MRRTPLQCEVELEDFTAKLVLPLDLKQSEAKRLTSIVEDSISDPSSAAKYAVSDPNICPEITL
jgi:hypothetical protein